MTPAGTSNELDVQNEREENTHTHRHCYFEVSRVEDLDVSLKRPKLRHFNDDDAEIQPHYNIFVTDNILEYKKAKNGDRGIIVRTAALGKLHLAKLT